jgi:hypothetical protein
MESVLYNKDIKKNNFCRKIKIKGKIKKKLRIENYR